MIPTATMILLGAYAVLSGATPWAEAVAVWHFADVNDSAGANSVLKPTGPVRVKVALTGAERTASLKRGGDGWAAEPGGGHFLAGQGAGGELNLTGKAMTMCIRLREPSGQWEMSLLSKYGSHDALVYNLFTLGRGRVAYLGFELGLAGRKGMIQVQAPLSWIASPTWHDIVVRYDGKVLALFVDGKLADRLAVSGTLRGGNTEPCVIGGHSVGGQVQRPFRGLIDHAALWRRALSDAEVAQLSGVAKVDTSRVRKKRPSRPASRYGSDMLTDPADVKKYKAFHDVIRSTDVETYARAARGMREVMSADPHRPIYHFLGPLSWMNDPNGVIYHKGQYHVFYQFDPIVDGKRSARTWGHAVSDDLVHWRDWPVAIWPDTRYDRNGVYSGNMVIDDAGVPTALYTGNVRGHAECYGMLARSRDGMVTWQKKLVMDQRPLKGSPVHWDAQVWKDGRTWYQLIGGTVGGRGAALIWTSDDLEKWTYRKPIHTGGPGRFWELPYLLRFGEKYALLIGVRGNPYWVGSYDRKTMTFSPDRPQPRQADLGDYYSFNPNMTDDKGPGGSQRRIMHGWVTGPASPTKSVPYWQGLHSIPRVIHVEGDRLIQTPIPELRVLRGEKRSFGDLTVAPNATGLLGDLAGDAMEIIATFAPSPASRFGLKVRISPDAKRDTRVWYDAKAARFGVSGTAKGGAVSDLKPGQPVRMHVFLDKSVIEVYVNGSALTRRVFSPADARGVDLFADGGQIKGVTVDAWQMKSMWRQR